MALDDHGLAAKRDELLDTHPHPEASTALRPSEALVPSAGREHEIRNFSSTLYNSFLHRQSRLSSEAFVPTMILNGVVRLVPFHLDPSFP